MRFFAAKRTFQVVIILNISQINFTPDFSFHSHEKNLSKLANVLPSLEEGLTFCECRNVFR